MQKKQVIPDRGHIHNNSAKTWV